MIYLDNASTTKPYASIVKKACYILETNFGNPSSIHSCGRNTHKLIETAREKVAKSIGAKAEEIFFTSGATESNNIVARSFKYIVAHKYEHYSITKQPNFLDIDNLRNISKFQCSDIVISQMLVNNETGDIFEIPERRDYYLHVDATQAFGHIPINVKELGCDYLSLSGHKFHAPKGIGVLYVKNGDVSHLISQYGGLQEKGFRAGTENLFGIICISQACRRYKYSVESDKDMKRKKTFLLNSLEDYQPYYINAFNADNCVPNIVSLAFDGINAETLSSMLDKEGICVSTGSACHSTVLEKSPVLEALGVSDSIAYGTIRVSMSKHTSLKEIAEFITTTSKIINKLRGGN